MSWLKQRSTLEQQVGARPPDTRTAYRMSAYGRLWWRMVRWVLLIVALVAFVVGVIVGVTR